MTVSCDYCDKHIKRGETYYEINIATRVVGEPPPIYAAKLIQCVRCERLESKQ